jgi:hypothetical protein
MPDFSEAGRSSERLTGSPLDELRMVLKTKDHVKPLGFVRI